VGPVLDEIGAPSARPAEEGAQRGGTLTMVGAGDVEHLDPALAWHTVTRGILRASTRQLVGRPAGRDRAEASRIVADLATEVPTVANGRISHAGTEYAFSLRQRARWNTPAGPRRVTAHDVVRGIKRLAHPQAPSPGLPYYLSTVDGLAEFRDALAAASPGEVADRLASTAIRGVRARGDDEVVVTTRHPTSDFLSILALPFATPAPVEHAGVVPGSPALDRLGLSCGPYRLTEHVPGERIVLERNPAWDPASDPLRAAHVDRIVVREGLSEQAAHDLVVRGAADLLWDTQPVTAALPGLLASEDPRLEVHPAGLLSPYLVINLRSPAARHATGRLEVRRALQYAVDKAAVSRVWGGPRLNDIADQILPPLCTAHEEYRPYRTPGGRGDPDRARRLLAAAGYPDGLTLRLVDRNQDIHPETAAVVRAALARAGIDVRLHGVPIEDLFRSYFSMAAGEDRWDLALTGWEPDWYGDNARSYLQPLFDSRGVADGGDWGANFGRYRSERVNDLLTAALTCGDGARAAALFRAIEAQVLDDAAIVPILFAHQYWLHSARVRNWLPYPVLNGDLTTLWLDRPSTGRTSR
jgi:peptide/nickel transport system substrate-binding protein